MIQQQIKIWIIRLNGTILTEYIHKKVIEGQAAQNQSSTQRTAKDKLQPNADKQLQNDLLKEQIVAQLIDNSRKLSLSQYQNELNYIKIKKVSHYYRAKYNLLFVCANIDSQFTIAAIESVLENVIRLYEQKSSNISTGTKLPNILTHYQKQQLQKLQSRIRRIVDEQGYYQMVRKESLRDEGASERNWHVVHHRTDDIKQIGAREVRIREQNVRFLHQTEKNVNKYKIKMLCCGFFALLTLTLLLYCFYAYDVSVVL